jgi:hypothetical protein
MRIADRVGRVVVAAATAAALAAGGCARRPPAPADADMSGFLDDYSHLAPGAPDQPSFVYRDPDVRWEAYDRVVFEPITIWRSGENALAPVPPEDLARLAYELQHSVLAQLARTFTIVQQPGPATLRIRLALTQAKQTDPLLDVFTDAVPPDAREPGNAPLHPATRDFVAAAAIEGELSDAMSGRMLAEGVDYRRARALRTWDDVRAAADRWAAWFAGRLAEARRGTASR